MTLDTEAGVTELSLVLTGRANMIIHDFMLPLGMNYVLLLDETSWPRQLKEEWFFFFFWIRDPEG